jgi:uncharacterized protein YlaI
MMKVQCVICDQQSMIEDDCPLAKKLRNRPINTFMCKTCHDRIEENTKFRIASGRFNLYKYNTSSNEF